MKRVSLKKRKNNSRLFIISISVLNVFPPDSGNVGSVSISVSLPGTPSNTIQPTTTIRGTNPNPQIRISQISSASINVGQPYSYQVVASNSNGVAYTTYSLTQNPTNPSWLSISSTGLITGTAPNVPANTDYQVAVLVCDSSYPVNPTCASQSYTLTDVQPNPRPTVSATISPTFYGFPWNRQYGYQVVANSPNGDSLTYSLTQNPSITIGGNADNPGSSFNLFSISSTGFITPNAIITSNWQTIPINANGNYKITIQVCDSLNPTACTSQDYTITIPPNQNIWGNFGG